MIPTNRYGQCFFARAQMPVHSDYSIQGLPYRQHSISSTDGESSANEMCVRFADQQVAVCNTTSTQHLPVKESVLNKNASMTLPYRISGEAHCHGCNTNEWVFLIIKGIYYG